MLPTHAVGIDLGTTYSCISYLNEHGEPITIPNEAGELATPSVVLIDGNDVVVGTEALRNAIRHPDQVIMNSKRFIGDRDHGWHCGGRSFSPVDVAAIILRHLLENASRKIGTIEQAVITVPAQFSDIQRQATAEAGRQAGLRHVDIINEPVAAALCFVLGTEGIWFTELATTQQIMVFDLGGGTFDLSLVRYQKNEVKVIASGGDLQLGGIDFNRALERAIAKQFAREFQLDPRQDRESMQALALEVEQTKRSLSVRPRAALICQHAGARKTYQVELEQFERLSKSLVDRTEEITRQLLADNKMGWAHVDVVLTTGGASRMPMIRTMLKRLSGRTLNTALSPDQSIAHGATYYAGMLLTNSEFARSILNPAAAARLSQFKQYSVSARALGILVRDLETQRRQPHYILPASTQLPASVSHTFGTVSDNQRRVNLHIIESGTSDEDPHVELGQCVIAPLPDGLPAGSEIEVTISYDSQARVHVSAKEKSSGVAAQTEIVRPENLVVRAISEDETDAVLKSGRGAARRESAPQPAQATRSSPVAAQPAAKRSEAQTRTPRRTAELESADMPIPLCNECGEPLDARGQCSACSRKPQERKPAPRKGGQPSGRQRSRRRPASAEQPKSVRPVPLPADEDEIIELGPAPSASRSARAKKKRPSVQPPPPPRSDKEGEQEFWLLPDD